MLNKSLPNNMVNALKKYFRRFNHEKYPTLNCSYLSQQTYWKCRICWCMAWYVWSSCPL